MLEPPHGSHVIFIVERGERVFARAFAFVVGALVVAHLNARRVLEDDHHQIERGGGGEDGTFVTRLRQYRDTAGVIEMGMGDDDSIDGRNIFNRGAAVQIIRPAAALKHAAIDDDAGLFDFDEIAGSGDLATSGSIWGDFHDLRTINRAINVSRRPVRGDVFRKFEIKLLPEG